MAEKGFIKIYRSLLTWEWYEDTNTVRLFLHLLLTANHKTGRWKGMEIKRGQRVCSLDVLAKETRLSSRQVRTALNRLISTNSVTKRTTNRYTLITIANYDKFQSLTDDATEESDKPHDKLATNSRQASDKQTTTIKECKNERMKEEKKKDINPPLPPLKGFPPETQEQNPMKRMIGERDLPEAVKEKVWDWVEYKDEKHQGYKPRGFKSLLTTVEKNVRRYGENAVLGLMEECMAANWQGIIWERLERSPAAKPGQAKSPTIKRDYDEEF